MVAVWAPIKYYKQLKYITMDAFFNALKAKFQKGGSVKKYPRGVKEGGTPPKGKGMKPDGGAKPYGPNRKKYDEYKPSPGGKYTPPKGIKPATKEQKARIVETAKKIGKGKAKDSKMYGGSIKKKRMYGGSKKKMY